MLWQSTLVASVLAIGAQAGIGDLIIEGRTRNSPAVERSLEDMARASLRARSQLEARQSDGEDITAPVRPDGSLDIEAWNEEANTACRDALRGLDHASNPSGTCVCYNLPLLDNSTGTFEADLRLFQLSQPKDQFLGIPQDQIEVELSYNGASVTEVNQQAVSGLKVRQEDNGNNNDAGDLRLLQSYLFIGQVDTDRMTGQMRVEDLQALVMPIVTLKATDANGLAVSTIVSSNEAAFVAGKFSGEVFMSNFTMAELAVESDMVLLRNGTIAFVLPGIQLMIFPIGLVITSIWLVLGVAAYGMGTYQRYNFREAHKRRMAVVQKGAVARI